MMFGLLSSVARGTGSLAVRAVSFGAGTAWDVGQALVGPVAAAGRDLVEITRWPDGRSAPVRGAPGSGARPSVAVPLAAAAMDVAAVAGAVAGKLGRFPAAPRAARAAVAVVRHQPRVVALLRARLGPVGADMVLTAATAAAHGWGQAPAVPLLDLAQRIGQLGEMVAYRQAWAVWEPVLAAVDRPRSFPSPVAPVDPAGHGPPAPDAAVSPPAEAGSPVPPAPGGTGGQIESYLDQAASGSLVAAAGTLLAGGDAEDVAGAVLAGVPNAAQLGREEIGRAHV